MSFVVKKLPLAEQDALEAAIWYEERQPGLGDEFLTEVDRAVHELSESASLYRVRFADVRQQQVWVLAIFHGRRHPRQLEERRKEIT
jgi:plasmid stabilization system protein ParE